MRVRDRLKLEDAEIHYEVTGDGPAIVFAHGLGGNHMSWYQQVPHFSPRFTCITFAHRGFTPSRELVEGRGPAAFPADLAALIDHLKLDRVVLVAQSMGGWSCLPYALSFQNRVRGLVMACTAGTNYRLIAGLKIDGLEAYDAWAAERRTQYERDGIHPAGGARLAREQPAAHFLYREIDDLTPAAAKQGLRKRMFENPAPGAAALAALRIPVVFFTGDDDIVFPPVVAQAMAQVMPNARVERFAAGHSIYFERPAEFNAALDRFIAALPA
jgi:3-oxoadipate enol-lactonase